MSALGFCIDNISVWCDYCLLCHCEVAVCQDELKSLCQQHYREELDMQLGHHSSICVMLQRLAVSRRDHVMTSLDNVHERQVRQLKRHMDSGNKSELKQVAASFSDKHELARYMNHLTVTRRTSSVSLYTSHVMASTRTCTYTWAVLVVYDFCWIVHY